MHIQQLNTTATETVVLLHGMFSNLSVYYFQIAPILAQRYRVVMYDLKSHGLSEKAASGYSLQAMCDELLGLLDKLQLERVHIAGYSFGALITLQAVMQAPHRFQRVVAIEAPNPADDRTLQIIDNYDKDFLVSYIENFTDTTKSRMGKRQLEKNHRMYEYLFHETSIRQDMVHEHDYFSTAAFDQLVHPLLLLYGNSSDCLDAGKLLQERISGATLHTLKGNHNLPVQQPELTANIMSAFLQAAKIPHQLKPVLAQ